MPTVDETIESIVQAHTWEQRIAQIRLVPQHHGTGDHATIHAAIAQRIYVPNLAPDFAYVHEDPFYEHDHFFRTITGLTKNEFGHSTQLAGAALDLPGVSGSKVDSLERGVGRISDDQARVLAVTIMQIMAGTLFGEPTGDVKSKQQKPDTEGGWSTVQKFAKDGVPYGTFLHQRHYGGAFRQVLDATSTKRGDLIEDAVEELFAANHFRYIRTGSHNQGDIEARFGIQVTPAPDFVVFDSTDTLRAMLECKGANDGGTARDKALRFARLRQESIRLGGVPLLAVLGGIGWARVNDTLGPVVRDTDGRVFTLSNLDEMLAVAPFLSLRALTGVADLHPARDAHAAD